MENIPKAIKEFNEFRYDEEDIYTKSKWKGDWDNNNAVLLIASEYVCDSKEEEDSCHINYYTKYDGSERFNEWLDKYNFEIEWENQCILYVFLKKQKIE